MAKVTSKSDQSVCIACKDPVGEKYGELPMSILEDEGSGDGASETFCPRCFVHTRGARDSRFATAIGIGMINAVACTNVRCKMTSVSFGSKSCQQCGSRALVLPPKNTIFSSKTMG